MILKKCDNGHFYNGDKYNRCPHCSSARTKSIQKVEDRLQRTEILYDCEQKPEVSEDFVNMSIEQEKDNLMNYKNDTRKSQNNIDSEKTVSIYDIPESTPTVGWLICIEGEHFGEDFRIKTGRNYIGRNFEMDIVLDKAKSISRIKHALIVYDPKNNKFIVQPGESNELIYLNNQVLLTSEELQIYDNIGLGTIQLLFIPLCNKEFSWESHITKEKKGDGNGEI